jgi:hypothetical protein
VTKGLARGCGPTIGVVRPGGHTVDVRPRIVPGLLSGQTEGRFGDPLISGVSVRGSAPSTLRGQGRLAAPMPLQVRLRCSTGLGPCAEPRELCSGQLRSVSRYGQVRLNVTAWLAVYSPGFSMRERRRRAENAPGQDSRANRESRVRPFGSGQLAAQRDDGSNPSPSPAPFEPGAPTEPRSVRARLRWRAVIRTGEKLDPARGLQAVAWHLADCDDPARSEAHCDMGRHLLATDGNPDGHCRVDGVCPRCPDPPRPSDQT